MYRLAKQTSSAHSTVFWGWDSWSKEAAQGNKQRVRNQEVSLRF